MPLEACIFDLDGVIVDTAKYHFLAWQRLAKDRSIPFTEEDNEQLKGVSRMKSLDILLSLGHQSVSDEERMQLASRKNEWFVEYILQMTPEEILPGVMDFIKQLDDHNIRKALGSASKNAGTVLKQIGLADEFEVIIDGNKISKAKPDPEVFLAGAKGLGVEPENCVVFEDALAGVQAAHNGHMKCVGVGSPDILGEAEMVIPGFDGLQLNQIKKLFE